MNELQLQILAVSRALGNGMPSVVALAWQENQYVARCNTDVGQGASPEAALQALLTALETRASSMITALQGVLA